MRTPSHPLAAAVGVAVALTMALPAAAQSSPPTTGFEDRGGETWTTHQEELDFLEAVASASPRVEVDVLTETEVGGRPVHLVRIGDPVPHTLEAAQDMPVELHICTQHGNEPAGREACLKTIRDLAFTDDADLVGQLQTQVTLFVPTVNPDGREANQRTNGAGVDLNRNHLEVQQPETRAVGRVIRDWKPVMNMDHHEYGPIIPALYDDDILYLWSRNLNVHRPLRDMAKSFAVDHLRPCIEARGYRSDEYGQYSLGEGQEPAPDLDLQQSAGDEDDGISRNAAGLRHSIGILIESFSPDIDLLEDGVGGVVATTIRNRRVDAQREVIDCTMEWMRENGQDGYAMTRESMAAKKLEGIERSAPLFFDGQDEDTTVTGSGEAESTSFADPPPCGYLVGPGDAVDFDFEEAADVHGLELAEQPDGSAFVTMGQVAEPVVGLLLDARGTRHLIEAEPLDDCNAFVAGAVTPAPAAPAPEPASEPLPTTGGGLALLGLTALLGARGLRRR